MSKSVKQLDNNKSVDQILDELEELRERIVRVEKDDVELKQIETDKEKLRENTKLYESEERFHKTFEQTSDGFFVLDYDGSIFDVNRHACKSLGFSREELLAMNISEVDIEVTPMKQRFLNSLIPGQYLIIAVRGGRQRWRSPVLSFPMKLLKHYRCKMDLRKRLIREDNIGFGI